MKRQPQLGSKLLGSAKALHPATMYAAMAAVAVVGYTVLRLASASATTLYYSPPTGTVSVGSNITTAIRLNTDEQVKLVRAVVTYPANLLQYVGVDGSGSAFGIDAGTSDSGTGTIYVTRYSYSNVSGDQLVSTLTFKAKTAGTATLGFGTGTNVFRASDNYPLQVNMTNGVYNLSDVSVAPPVVTQPAPPPVPVVINDPSIGNPPPPPVVTPPVAPPMDTAPKVSILANGRAGSVTMSINTPLTISWSTTNSPTSCNAAGAATFSGAKSMSGSENHTIDTSTPRTITYYLACTNSGGMGYGYVLVTVVGSSTSGVTISGSTATKLSTPLTSVLNFRKTTTQTKPTTAPKSTKTTTTTKTTTVPRVNRSLNPVPVNDPIASTAPTQGEVQLTAATGSGAAWPVWLTVLSGVASAGAIIFGVRLGLVWWERRRNYL